MAWDTYYSLYNKIQLNIIPRIFENIQEYAILLCKNFYSLIYAMEMPTKDCLQLFSKLNVVSYVDMS